MNRSWIVWQCLSKNTRLCLSPLWSPPLCLSMPMCSLLSRSAQKPIAVCAPSLSTSNLLSARMCVCVCLYISWGLKKTLSHTLIRTHTLIHPVAIRNSQQHAAITEIQKYPCHHFRLSAAFYVDTKNFSFPGGGAEKKMWKTFFAVQQTFSCISKNNFYAQPPAYKPPTSTPPPKWWNACKLHKHQCTFAAPTHRHW